MIIQAEDDPKLSDRRNLCVCPFCDEDLLRDSHDGHLYCEGRSSGCSFAYDDSSVPLTPEVADHLLAHHHRRRIAERDPTFDEGSCCPLCAYEIAPCPRDDTTDDWYRCKNPDCGYEAPTAHLDRAELRSTRLLAGVSPVRPWDGKPFHPRRHRIFNALFPFLVVGACLALTPLSPVIFGTLYAAVIIYFIVIYSRGQRGFS